MHESKVIALAQRHLDGIYSRVYGKAWPSMRLGLLTTKKHCAIQNSFVDTTISSDAIQIKDYYKSQLNESVRISEKERKTQVVLPTHPDVREDSSLEALFSDRRLDEDDKYFINKASTRLSLDDYVPATEMIYKETSPELFFFEDYEQNIDLQVERRVEPPLEFDDQLKVYVFPRGSWESFPPPSVIKPAGLFSHYLLDGASVLAVLTLDIRLNDLCADYCAAPGGKSLAMLMTLKPKYLLSNDFSASRVGRLGRVFKQYLPDISYIKTTLNVTKKDARTMIYPDTFDKILVDAPCLNDRSSVESIDNNIFKRTRTEERLELPVNQVKMLTSALKSLKVDGAVVYSTCTLSPVENDGVIQKALLRLQEEGHPSKFAIMDLEEAFMPLHKLFKFNTKLKYGQQVVPSVCSNFGPMYISKIKRIS